MKERVKPYLITYSVWFILLIVLILNSKTENGDPYPVAAGIFLSVLCAAVFSFPIWIVQGLYFYIRKRIAVKKGSDIREPLVQERTVEECAEPIPQQKVISQRQILDCKEPHDSQELEPQVSGAMSLQDSDGEKISLRPEVQKGEELEREAAAAELRKRQKEIAQEAIARNQRAQQEQAAQKDAYRNQRAEVVRGMSHAALLQDAIRFASTQFYITAEEMELEYPTLSAQERERMLSDLERMGAIQPRPGTDSWLSLVDQETAKRLIEKISEKPDEKEKQNPSMDQMDGQAFEHFCADLLRNNGFTHVEVTQASGDFGIDILAKKDGVTYGIQCKCYSDTVGNHAVQEALSGAQYYHRMVAVVMTNNYFTPAAVETARRTNVLLWDRDKVLVMNENARRSEV